MRALWSDGPLRAAPDQKTREAMWTLQRNHQEFECVLVSHGEDATEVQVVKNGVFLWAMRFALRREALACVETERARLLQK